MIIVIHICADTAADPESCSV